MRSCRLYCRVLAAVYQLPDGVYGTVSGVLRGLGRQPQLLWVNLGGFWLVGMVLGIFLTFKAGLGEIGLWWGLLAGITATGARSSPSEVPVWEELEMLVPVSCRVPTSVLF
jgi:Na+-driven multidrug efflux pump